MSYQLETYLGNWLDPAIFEVSGVISFPIFSLGDRIGTIPVLGPQGYAWTPLNSRQTMRS